jgi:hypothetical protein
MIQPLHAPTDVCFLTYVIIKVLTRTIYRDALSGYRMMVLGEFWEEVAHPLNIWP